MVEAPANPYIVAIGASAGGLEAFTEFFDHAGVNDELSYILVQHLSPDHKSALVDLLSRHTKMKVILARHGNELKAGNIFVIPPGKHMTVASGKLELTDKDPTDKSPNIAIDTFFYSLALEYEDRAIAVVLSGTGTDGSRGIEAVREHGGLVIAQDPKTSKFDGMPRSSIATGKVDMILPVREMNSEIINYVRGFPYRNDEQETVNSDTLKKILDAVHKTTGCDFNNYKLPTVLRRLAKRLSFLKLTSVNDYLRYINSNPEEGHVYCKELLIGVTRFFRDKEAFEALEKKVLMPLIDSKPEWGTVKIWVTACSTGEEAYSIAILLNELLRKKKRNLEVKIFATDLDQHHIERASRGEYGKFISREIDSGLLDRYFTKKEHTYVIVPGLRKQIVFARHNLASDVPFIKNDVISCRNMLIYIEPALQQKILSRFYFGLNEDGALFLGASEHIGSSENFDELDRKWKIYRKGVKAPHKSYVFIDRKSAHDENEEPPKKTAKKNNVAVQDRLQEVVFKDFGVAAFYIGSDQVIRDAIGDYKKYLIFPNEGLQFNLVKMLPESLAIPVSTAIMRAWKNKTDVVVKDLTCELKGEPFTVKVSIRTEAGVRGLTLVVFNAMRAAHGNLNFSAGQDFADIDQYKAEVATLREHLEKNRINLQTVVEELESTNEELQSSNEELLSSNEELQSSNEELQSLNEELHTLNTEHQQRIQDLVELNDDLDNYFRCNDVGQIFLDKKLCIRKFNPAARRLVNLMPKDVGRPFLHLTTNFIYPDLDRDLANALSDKGIIEKEVQGEDGVTLLVRIYPYVRKDDVIAGVVLGFVDITQFKQLNSIINSVFDASKNPILALGAVRNKKGKIEDLITVTTNVFAREFFELEKDGISLRKVDPSMFEQLFHAFSDVIDSGKPFSDEVSARQRWFDLSAVKMMDGLVITLNDVSDRKNSEAKVRQGYAELYSTREKLKILNRDLENIVSSRTKELADSEERFRLVSSVTNDALVDWRFMDNSIWLSENYKRLFGYTDEDIVLNRSFWLEKVHPDDVVALNAGINECINTGATTWNGQYRYRAKDGSYRMINDRGFFVSDENGTPYRMLSSMLDITELRKAEMELKESEMRFRLALDGADMAGWEIDLATDKLIYSRKLPKIFGRPFSENFTSALLRSQFHPEDAEKVAKLYESALRGEPYNYEARIVWPNGSVHWIKTIGNLLLDEHGKSRKLVGITRETTREKNTELSLEEKVRERTQALIKSNSDLEQFAYIASHDLQEPLRKIQTFISLIAERKNDPELVDRYFEKINSSAARMSALIRNVLQFSRLSHHNEGFIEIDLSKLITQLLDDFELKIREKKAKITVSQLPVIEGITHQVSQLFYNLIDNALKFNDNEPQISIVAEPCSGELLERFPSLEAAVEYVCVRVTDNGIGFDDKYSEKMFSFFYRHEKSKDYPGEGIGLALCKKIVHNHNGVIFVNSEKGMGSVFTIILPLRSGHVSK